MTNKQFFITTILLCVFTLSFSQTKATALRDAKITSKATLDMDFKTVLKHTYPSIVDLMGGTTAAEHIIENMFKDMTSQGFVFEKAEVQGVSEIVKEQNQFRCYTHSINVMKINNQRITSTSYLLGIYDEEKQIWYFLEADKLQNKMLADKILPNFKTNLNIPKDETKMEVIEN
jgi:hypothetical protein